MFASNLFAQNGSYPSLPRDSSRQNTVSINQLLVPSKAMRAAQHARDFFIAGRIDQAQKEITRALDISPHFGVALSIQGAIHLQIEQFGDAAEEFHEAIEADPALGPAYLGLAMSLIARRRFEDALGPLDRAATLLPGAWLVHFEAALDYLDLDDTKNALQEITYAERLAGIDPNRRSGTAFMRSLICIRQRDHDQAKKYLEKAIECEPNGFYATRARERLIQLDTPLGDSTSGSLLSSLVIAK